jgi:hypothetical protein
MSFVRYRKSRKWAFKVIVKEGNYMKIDLPSPSSEFCFVWAVASVKIRLVCSKLHAEKEQRSS